jgi:hypothetical protein
MEGFVDASNYRLLGRSAQEAISVFLSCADAFASPVLLVD